jgi:hypothetical protein
MMIVSEKDLHIGLTNGGACRLKAGVPRDIPDIFAAEAIRRGAMPHVEEKVVYKDREPEPKPELNSGTPPEEQVEEPSEETDLAVVMQQIIERADPADLRGDGTPKATVVNKLAGRPVDADERESAWAEALTKED